MCASSSNLADMLTMVNRLIFEVTVQRWRSRWVSLTNVGCAGMLRFALNIIFWISLWARVFQFIIFACSAFLADCLNPYKLVNRDMHLANTLLGAAVADWLSFWLAEQEDRGSIPGLATWIFRDWLSPASKSRYGWKIAKSTLVLKTINQPTLQISKPIQMIQPRHAPSQ